MSQKTLEKKLETRILELKKEREDIQNIKAGRLCSFFSDILLEAEKLYTIKEQNKIFNKVIGREISYPLFVRKFRQFKGEKDGNRKKETVIEKDSNRKQKKTTEKDLLGDLYRRIG